MTIKILAIESSCDETAAAIVGEGFNVYANVIASQIAVHQPYGGVVPEIASRHHLDAIVPVVEQALADADIKLEDIDAIAVTQGPGLIGSLLVGVSYAKALAYAAKKPLIAVHHLEGHMLASFLEHKDLTFPFLALVVSGSHSGLVLAEDFGRYRALGQSRDDAAGEAFDKIARALGLPYPGGPSIQVAAKAGKVIYDFPRALLKGTYDFSFSGLKSAVLNFLNHAQMKGESYRVEDVAASAQEAIVDILAKKAAAAAAELGLDTIVLAGGVAANEALRAKIKVYAPKQKLVYPSLIFCTDNAAMIGAAALPKYAKEDFATLSLNAVANFPINKLFSE
ncbi:MAG: tRNA (adenosine(37)-N6)-threonylcarbamoyltransferase complex transferase subunit TsaD [Clostridia bacterium]|jgi:N6-L-threonylcarbamoyladenine synthase|nr:tRNA (adenosine(37)-N6)-threonylcarbamoyltransferase complex transferase subunit TsaD [Clostridia bacterium]